MNWKLIVGALVMAICGWSILQIGRMGAVRGRMGGEWSRKESAGIYWLSASALAAGLFAGTLLVSAGLGDSSLLAEDRIRDRSRITYSPRVLWQSRQNVEVNIRRRSTAPIGRLLECRVSGAEPMATTGV